MAIFNELADRRELLRIELTASAGIDPLEDRRRVGYIAAINDLLNIQYDEVGSD